MAEALQSATHEAIYSHAISLQTYLPDIELVSVRTNWCWLQSVSISLSWLVVLGAVGNCYPAAQQQVTVNQQKLTHQSCTAIVSAWQ